MNYIRLFYTFLLFVSVILAILLIKYSCKRRSIPGANYFILLLFTAIIYSGAYMGELNSSSFSFAMFWFYLEHISIPAQHYFWIMMCLEYVAIDRKYSDKLKYILLYHPVLYYIIFYTNSLHHLYISSYRFESNGYFYVIITTKGILYTISVISGTILAALATFLYIRGCIKAPRLQRSSYLLMIIASLFPWSTVYLQASNNNYLGIDYYPVVCAISGIFYVYGIFRLRIFNTIPVATEIVFRQAKEGILLLDLTNRIIDVNNSAICLYPELARLTKDSTFLSFTERHPEFQGILEDRVSNHFHYSHNPSDRYYSAEVTKILAENNLQIGTIITITDITRIYEHQKNLETIATDAIDKAELNEISFLQAQISPHFINNALSTIASMITVAPKEAKELITDLGDYLANCCYFNSETGMVLLEKEIETIVTYVNIEKARFGERLKFNLVSGELPNIYIPRLILQPLVENAIRHGILKKVRGGTVQLRINSDTDRVYFEVVDDGVGMSEDKAASLTTIDNKNTGIGIMNIHRRLLKLYQEGLEVRSEIDHGTSVSFSIKYQETSCIK